MNDNIIEENRQLRLLLQEARQEADKWLNAWVEEKSLEEMGTATLPWVHRELISAKTKEL